MTVQHEDARTLALADYAAYYDVEYRNNYSGRGMYGRTCPALVGSMFDIAKVIAAMAVEDDLAEAAEWLEQTKRIDSMGLGYVAYWPAAEPLSDEVAALYVTEDY